MGNWLSSIPGFGQLLGDDSQQEQQQQQDTRYTGQSTGQTTGNMTGETASNYNLSPEAANLLDIAKGNAGIIPAAYQFTEAGAQPISEQQIQAIANPLLDQEIQMATLPMEQQFQTDRSQLLGQFAANPWSSAPAGALERQQALEAGQIGGVSSGITQEAYRQAQAAALAGQQQELQAGSTLGQEGIAQLGQATGDIYASGQKGTTGQQTSGTSAQQTSGNQTTTGTTDTQKSSFSPTGALTGALAFLSDERVKENMHPIGKLDDGQPVHAFNFKGDPMTHIGVSAQETLRHHPEAVHQRPDGFLAVDYSKLGKMPTHPPMHADGGSIGEPGHFANLVRQHFHTFHALRKHAENGGREHHADGEVVGNGGWGATVDGSLGAGADPAADTVMNKAMSSQDDINAQGARGKGTLLGAIGLPGLGDTAAKLGSALGSGRPSAQPGAQKTADEGAPAQKLPGMDWINGLTQSTAAALRPTAAGGGVMREHHAEGDPVGQDPNGSGSGIMSTVGDALSTITSPVKNMISKYVPDTSSYTPLERLQFLRTMTPSGGSIGDVVKQHAENTGFYDTPQGPQRTVSALDKLGFGPGATPGAAPVRNLAGAAQAGVAPGSTPGAPDVPSLEAQKAAGLVTLNGKPYNTLSSVAGQNAVAAYKAPLEKDLQLTQSLMQQLSDVDSAVMFKAITPQEGEARKAALRQAYEQVKAGLHAAPGVSSAAPGAAKRTAPDTAAAIAGARAAIAAGKDREAVKARLREHGIDPDAAGL